MTLKLTQLDGSTISVYIYITKRKKPYCSPFVCLTFALVIGESLHLVEAADPSSWKRVSTAFAFGAKAVIE